MTPGASTSRADHLIAAVDGRLLTGQTGRILQCGSMRCYTQAFLQDPPRQFVLGALHYRHRAPSILDDISRAHVASSVLDQAGFNTMRIMGCGLAGVPGTRLSTPKGDTTFAESALLLPPRIEHDELLRFYAQSLGPDPEQHPRPLMLVVHQRGITLQQLAEREELPLRRVGLITGTLTGMGQAWHQAGLLNQDIKPAHFFIDLPGRPDDWNQQSVRSRISAIDLTEIGRPGSTPTIGTWGYVPPWLAGMYLDGTWRQSAAHHADRIMASQILGVASALITGSDPSPDGGPPPTTADELLTRTRVGTFQADREALGALAVPDHVRFVLEDAWSPQVAQSPTLHQVGKWSEHLAEG